MYMNKKSITLCLLVVAVFGTSLWTVSEPSIAETSEKRVLYMTAVEPKGTTHIDKEPFPKKPAPKGDGYILKKPNENGMWTSGAYRFDPGLLVAYEGEEVELHIWGVHGSIHHSTIEGFNIPFNVERGQNTIVNFKADKPGIFNIVCHDHMPIMQAQLLILPKE